MLSQTEPSNPEDAIRVLHVDDERGQLKFTKSFVELSDSTIHMESVATPEAALRRLEEENFDCIVSDYQMPVLNGIELARRIRGFSDVPIIIYTGRGSEEVASKAFAAGIDDYMRKEIEPSHYEVLARRIRAAVEKHLYERRLGESVNQFRVLFDGIPDAIILIDPNDYTIIRANKAAFEHPWKEEVDVIGRHCYEVTHQRSSPCEPPDHPCPIRELLETGTSTVEVHLHHDRDGNKVYQEVSVFPVLDDEGRIVNAVHCSRDITAKLRMEMDLILVNKLNEAVNRGDSLQKIFGLLAKETGKNFSSFGSSVYLVSEDGEHLVLQNQTLPQPLLSSIEKLIGRSIPKVEIPLKPGSLYSEILGLNSPQLIQEPESIRRLIAECTENVVLKRLTPQIYSALGIRSVIVSPLVSEGETIGLLDISRRKPFRASDLERIKHIASQVATIIKRKKIEEDLLLERDKAQRYLDVASEILVALDAEGKVTLLNRSGCELLGWAKDEAVGRDWFESFIPERIRDDVKHVFGKLLSRDLGPVECYENPVLTINGEERLIDWHNTLLQDPAGKITGILSSGIDITERKKRETELRDSEERWRSLVELAPDGIMTVDLKGFITSINDAFSKLTGFSREEIVGKHFTRMGTLRARDIPTYVKLFASLLKGDIPPTYEFIYRRKDGSEGWAEAQFRLIETPEKKRELLAIVSDVSERKRMEEELKQHSEHLEELVQEKTTELSVSEERLRSFTASAPDAFTLYDSELNCLDVNEALLKYWPEGTRKEDLIGKNILDLSPYIKESGRYDRYLEVIKTGKPFQIEDPTAHPFLGDARLSLRAFKVGEGLGIITTDITDQKRMEEQLVEAERMSAMGRVSAMVGHDLRGPLQTIMNALFLMEKAPEKAGELRGEIEDSVNYATRILEDLRYSTGDVPVHLQETNVGALLQKIITSSTVPDSIRIDLDVGEGLTSVRLDPLMAQRVLDNLVRNSVEAMADGGVLSLSAFKEPDWVVIRVSDTGTGIPEEDLKHIFTLLFTSKHGGTGLGLAYCKRAVEAHGGTITVESEVDRGATFTVRIPMRDE